MKRALSVSWLAIAILLFALPALATEKAAINDCETCFSTSSEGTLDVNWTPEPVSALRNTRELLQYHDDTFEGQLGCGGGCAFGVRFTPDAPMTLNQLIIYTQGDAAATAAIISIYEDVAGGIAGPPSMPAGPGDGTAVWESAPMDLTAGTYTVTVPDLVFTEGDFYVILWENNSGFMGIANDLQTNYLDRNWVSTGGGVWETVDSGTGGDPTLTGNFGITADFTYLNIDGSYMTVAPTQVNLGVIQIADGAVSADVSINNLGNEAFNVTAIDYVGDAGFSTSLAAPVVVDANSTVTLDVVFTPTVAGVFDGTFTITSDADNAQTADVTAGITVFDGFPEYFVWNPSMSISGQAFVDALVELGYTAYADPNLFFFGDPLDAGFSAVFVTLGIFPDNFTIGAGSAEALALADFAAAGSPLYMEGGDTWAYDAPSEVHGYFGIEGLADGAGDLTNIVGATLWAGYDYAYEGANNYIDDIAPLGVDAFISHVNPTDGAACGVANLSPTVNTIGNSFEFGGLVDELPARSTKVELLASYLDFFAQEYSDIWPPVIEGVTTYTYTLDTEGPYVVDAMITDNVGVTSASLFYCVDGGAFNEVAMTADGTLFSGDIPGQPVGSFIEYYVAAYDAETNEALSPATAPDLLYNFNVVSHLPPTYVTAQSGLDGTVALNWMAPGTEFMNVTIEIFTDAFPGETSWDIFDDVGNYIDGIAAGELATADMLYTWDLELEPGTYFFTIYDSYGDGICCTYGDGYYNLYVNDALLATGGDFGVSATHEISPVGLLSLSRSHYDGYVQGAKGGQPENLVELNIVNETIIENTALINSMRNTRELMSYSIFRDGVELVAGLDLATLSYLDQYIPNGVQYCYYILAVYDDGTSPSQTVCATPVNHAPAPPTNLQGVVDGMDVTLDWDDNTEYDFALYNVYRNDALVATVSASNYSETLEIGAFYNYYVTAIDEEDAESEASEDITLPVGNLPPMNLEAESGLDGTVYLEWDPPGTMGPGQLECADYMIEDLPYMHQSTNLGMGDDFDVSSSDGEDVAYQLWMPEDGYVDITLCADYTNFDTKLEIFNEDCFTTTGNYNDDDFDCEFSGVQSSLYNQFLAEGIYLIVVDGFSGATGDYEINVTESGPARENIAVQGEDFELQKLVAAGLELQPWQLSSAPQRTANVREFIGYNVYRDDALLTDPMLGPDVIDYTDQYIPNGVEYCYYVEAVYDDGDNSVTPVVCATTMNHPPAPPMNLMGSSDGNDAMLDWDDNTEYDFFYYNVYRNGEMIAQTSASEYTETLEFGGFYEYWVTAVDEEEAESDPSDDITLPVGNLPPMNLDAESGLDGTVYLEWDPPGTLGPDPLDCADYVIDGLPYSHQGSNVGMGDDFDVELSDGEDVAYQLWMEDDGYVDITLCSAVTDYDTKLEIFNEDCFTTTGFYDDDGSDCPESPSSYNPSELFGIFLTEGNYLIVVDGFSGATGNYEITVTEGTPTRSVADVDHQSLETEKLAAAGIELASWQLSSALQHTYTVREHVGYNLYRDDVLQNTDALLPIETIDYTDQYIPNGIEYCYYVEAVYDDGDNSITPTVCATPMNHPPAMPMNFAGEGDEDGNVSLSWDANTDYDFASYNVYRDEVLLTNTTDLTFTEVLAEAGYYDYAVAAVDAEDAESEWAEMMIPVGPVPPGFVSAQSGLDGQVLVQWTAPGDLIMDFSVEIFTDTYYGETSWDLIDEAGNVVATDGGMINAADALFTWDLEISPGIYTWTIYDSFGDGICCTYGDGYYNIYVNGTQIATGGDFGISESWTFDAGGIVTMRSLTRSEYVNEPTWAKGETPVNPESMLTYTTTTELNEEYAVESTGIRVHEGYNVYRDGVQVNETVLGTDVFEYLDGYIPNAVEYCYTVSAVYTSAETQSEPACATPMNHPPETPMNLIGSVDDVTGAVSLDWDDNTDYDIASYNVYANGELEANVPTSDYTYTPEDAVYRYQVSAVDADGGESDLSASVTLIVGEAPPENLRANGHFDDHVQLSWYPPGGGGVDTEFRYDDGTATGQLGYPAAPEFGLMGNSHSVNGMLYSVSWYLTAEGGPHAEVRVVVLGLDEMGIPDHNDVLFVSDLVPNIDEQWNDFELPEPIEAPEGFFIGINVPFAFAGIGTDDGIGEPYDFIAGTQWAIYDYTDPAEAFSDIGDFDFPNNFLIRGYGQLYGELDMTNDLSLYISPKEDADRLELITSDPVNVERPFIPENTGLRDVDYYSVFADGDLIGQTSETTFAHMVEEGPSHSHFYNVTATYTNGLTSGPSNEVEAYAWMAPLWPLEVQAVVQGHSVILEWVDPSTNEDGTACNDLDGIMIYRNGQQVGTQDPFEWTFTENGVPDGGHVYEIMAYDEVPNYSIPAMVDVWIGPAPYVLEIFTDAYPGETSWDLADANGNVVMGVAAGELTSPDFLYEWILDEEPGMYTFTIYDAWGDGICCSYGDGYYQIVHGDEIIASGGEFATDESVTFEIEEGILYGDLNFDGVLTINDLTRFIEIVTVTGALPTPEEIAVLDMNADGSWNILDVVILLEAILEFPVLAKDVPTDGAATVEIPPTTLFNTREWQDIPVHVTYEGFISGFEAHLSFDPEVIELGTPTLAEGNDNDWVHFNMQDGNAIVLAVDLAGSPINVETGLLMNVPVQVIDETATGPTDFTVDELILAGPGGATIETDFLVSLVEIGLPLPSEYTLNQNYPNPFNPTTTISYALPEASNVQLVVYNMLGQAVKTLVNDQQDAGYYDVQWLGTDDAGQQLSTGVYIYHLRAGDFSKTFKMAYIK